MVLRVIKPLLVGEALVLASALYSQLFFINIQVAFLSSLFVILGASFAYKRVVDAKVGSDVYEEQRDLLDTIEDPHELYEMNNTAINEAPAEALDLKAIVKEERAKIKTFSLESIKHGAGGTLSLLRLVPYVLLILGFIALKNNNILDLRVYLPALLIGIIAGSFASKEISA